MRFVVFILNLSYLRSKIYRIGIKDLRRNIAIVSQEIFLFRGTIAENIRYARQDATMEEAVALSDSVLEEIEKIEGIESVGAMMSGSGLLSMGGSGENYDVTVYINLTNKNASGAKVGKQIEEACAGMECAVSASSAMMDMIVEVWFQK